jgi:hypothetical protein
VSLLEESYMVTVSDIASRTGFETATVARALEALDPDYVDFRKTTTGGDPTFWYVLKVTPQARSAVGQWPTPDSFVTKLSAELSAAASQEPDAERKSLLSYAARLIGDTLREAAVRAAGQVLAPAMGPALPPSTPSTPPADEQLPLAEAARAATSAASGSHSPPSSGSHSPLGSGSHSPSSSGGHSSPVSGSHSPSSSGGHLSPVSGSDSPSSSGSHSSPSAETHSPLGSGGHSSPSEARSPLSGADASPSTRVH